MVATGKGSFGAGRTPSFGRGNVEIHDEFLRGCPLPAAAFDKTEAQRPGPPRPHQEQACSWRAGREGRSDRPVSDLFEVVGTGQLPAVTGGRALGQGDRDRLAGAQLASSPGVAVAQLHRGCPISWNVLSPKSHTVE